MEYENKLNIFTVRYFISKKDTIPMQAKRLNNNKAYRLPSCLCFISRQTIIQEVYPKDLSR